MKRIRSGIFTIAAIAAITLALDFLVTLFVPGRHLDAWVRLREKDDLVYDRTVAWNHTVKPNLALTRNWGPGSYPYASDGDGFRTGRCAATGAADEKDRTVFVIGDSFVEGIGVSFEDSPAGLLACAYRERGMAVRNLGTASYSPVIYWRKIAATTERLGLRPREIVLFLDISDVHNDAVDYIEVGDRVVIRERPLWLRVKFFLDRHFITWALAKGIYYSFGERRPYHLDDPVALWTVDKQLFDAWGRLGLERNAANLDRVVRQCAEWGCRLTLVVYPWPDQIARNDRDSIQIRHWRDWSARNGVRFVEAFSPFFELPARDALDRYFIPGDLHYSVAGNRLVFDKVWKEIDPAR